MSKLNQEKHPSIGRDLMFKGIPNQAIRGVNGKQRREMNEKLNKEDNFFTIASVIALILAGIWFFATN